MVAAFSGPPVIEEIRKGKDSVLPKKETLVSISDRLRFGRAL
jgi:hypothetical protein